MLSNILSSCLGARKPRRISAIHYTGGAYTSTVTYADKPSASDTADRFVLRLFNAPDIDGDLDASLKSLVTEFGWYDQIAQAILEALQQALQEGKEMTPVLKAAYDRAKEAVAAITNWADDHPELATLIVTLIAIGILALTVPWVLTYLGFAEEGIIAGQFKSSGLTIACIY